MTNTDHTSNHDGLFGWVKVALALLLVVILGGCATKPPTIVTQIERVYVEVPKQLLTPCLSDKPIDKESYMALSVYDREREMTLYAVSVLLSLGRCNAQIKAIRGLQGAAP